MNSATRTKHSLHTNFNNPASAMRYLALPLFLLCASALWATPPVVSNITFDGVSHSDLRVKFNVSAGYTNVRIRYAVSPNTCVSGTGASLQTQSAQGLYTTGMTEVVGGLIAGATYQICPEVSNDYTSTWSSGVGATVTMQPLPAIHPAPPIAPATFDPSYPDTTGFAAYTVAADCSDLMTAYAAAVARQATQGTVISIPAGTVCSAQNYMFESSPPDVQTWLPANVNTSNGVISLGGTPALHVGQGIVFGRTYGAATTYPASTSCEFGAGIQSGQIYYVRSVAAGNAVTLNCTDNATPMAFTTQGASTSGGFFWASLPRLLQPIIIRAATPDNQLPPEHTQITPAWKAKMASFIDPLVNVGQNNRPNYFMLFGDTDSNLERLVSNIRIGPGIEITTADSPEAHQSSDPLSWYTIFFSYPWNSNITLDRVYVHGLGTPNRMHRSMFWDGSYMSLVDSYFENLVYFHSMYSGLALAATSGGAFTIAPGTNNAGGGPINLASSVTVTLAGTGTGRAFVYFDLLNHNALTVSTPAGVSASCAGATCASAVAGASDGSCYLTDGWPKNSSTDPTAALVGCVDYNGSAITATTAANETNSRYNAEGCSFMIGGIGPGPYVVKDNHLEGAGLMWHHDDGGGYNYIRGDYTYLRNYFYFPLKYLYGSSTSDGLRYFVRQPLEWKGGRRIQIYGNRFSGNWSEDVPASVFIALDSLNGEGVTDVDLQNNTFMHGPGLVTFGAITSGAFPTLPTNRYRFQNNLAWDIGGITYWVPGSGQNTPVGWVLEGPWGGEDYILNHNTIAGNVGRTPSILHTFDQNAEGVSVTNNIFYVSSADQGFMQDGQVPANTCSGLFGKAGADCKLTPSYTWDHNLMLGNGATAAAVHSWWPTLQNYFSDATLNTLGWFSYSAQDFHMASNYCAGCGSPSSDGRDLGADIDALNAAQGRVSAVGVPEPQLTATSATIAFYAPDSVGCPVDFSNSDPTVISNFTRIPDPGGPRSRTVQLTGLTSGTFYYFRVNCAVHQPVGKFRTR
jgi:hypothetical protein